MSLYSLCSQQRYIKYLPWISRDLEVENQYPWKAVSFLGVDATLTWRLSPVAIFPSAAAGPSGITLLTWRNSSGSSPPIIVKPKPMLLFWSDVDKKLPFSWVGSRVNNAFSVIKTNKQKLDKSHWSYRNNEFNRVGSKASRCLQVSGELSGWSFRRTCRILLCHLKILDIVGVVWKKRTVLLYRDLDGFERVSVVQVPSEPHCQWGNSSNWIYLRRIGERFLQEDDLGSLRRRKT